MKHANETPSLTDGNKLFLYQLLSQKLGTGKQTFVTRVEEVLSAERLGAEDLGFPSTRALLEVLPEFVKLTVFKGGRLYATIQELPAWNEALAAAAKKKPGAAAGGKPWKRKRGVKALKPVCPRRVQRAQPDELTNTAEEQVEPASPTQRDAGADTTAKDSSAMTVKAASDKPARSSDASALPIAASDEQRAGTDTDADVSPAPDIAPAIEQKTAPESADDTASAAEAEQHEAAPTAATDNVTERTATGIALTVTFDPEHTDDGERILTAVTAAESATSAVQNNATADATAVPVAPDTRPATPTRSEVGHAATAWRPESRANRMEDDRLANAAKATGPSPEQRATLGSSSPDTERTVARGSFAAPAPLPGPVPSERARREYPRDFACEVRCPAELLGVLVRIVPIGVDALSVLAEDFRIARGMDTVRGTRTEASFPLRATGTDGSPVIVRLERSAAAGAGTHPTWTIASIDNLDDEQLAHAGIDGLPTIGDPTGTRAFARDVFVADEALARDAAALTPDVWGPSSLREQLARAYALARENGTFKHRGTVAHFPTGLFTADGPAEAFLTRTDDDIPWRFTELATITA